MKYREKRSIIIGFYIALFIFIFIIIINFIYIYPNVINIENDKIILDNDIEKYSNLIKKGIEYKDFKSLMSNKDDLEITKESEILLKNIDNNFYDNSIYETGYNLFKTDKKFSYYLSDRTKFYEDYLNSDEFNKKTGDIYFALPKYTSYLSVDSPEYLTDLGFVSYVEKLLNGFHLKNEGSIGINSIIPVENNEGIYYIPLEFKITGTKLNILDFLEYIKNTGNVIFSNNDITFTNKKGAKSQLSEIEKFSLDEYIDSYHIQRNKSESSLKEYIINTNQGNDFIKLNLSLKFYVNSISKDVIINDIENVIGDNIREILLDENGEPIKDDKTGESKYQLIHYNYINLLNFANKLKGDPILNSNAYYKTKINDILLYLNNNDLKKDFLDIKTEISKKDDLNFLYLKVMKYKTIFTGLDNEILNIVKSLGVPLFDEIDEEGKIIEEGFYTDEYIIE